MLKEELAEIDAVLQESAPFIHAKLAAPATAAEIETLRAGLGGVRVETLEVWFGWHNGTTDLTTHILPLGRVVSIAEALEDRAAIQKIPFVDKKRKRSIKILDDGAGDGFYLDITSDNPRVFYDMLEDPGPRDFGTLEQFVAFIKQVHQAGVAVSRRSNGMIDFNLARYDEIEARYLQAINSM